MNNMSTLYRSILLFLVVNIGGFSLPLQEKPGKISVSTKTIGPFTIGRVNQMNVYARTIHVRLGPEYQYWGDSDTALVVLDNAGKELFRRSSQVTLGGGETSFECSQVYLPTVGYTLMCVCTDAPASSNEGTDIQFFGINLKNKFVPLTGTIPQNSYKLVFLDSRTKKRPILIDSLKSYARPAIEITLWSGSYGAKVYYRIYSQGLSGSNQPELFHFDQIPVDADSADIARWRREENKETNTVSLYAQPSVNYPKDEGNDSLPNRSSTSVPSLQKIVVNSTSKLKFYYASYFHGWWLLVSIDGHIGYLTDHGCQDLGFPATDGAVFELGDDY